MISNIIVNRHCTNALCLNISFYERKSLISVMAVQKLHIPELILKL